MSVLTSFIQIKVLIDENSDDTYYCRGHQDKAEFLRALQEYLGDDFKRLNLTHNDIEHEYYKIVPCKGDFGDTWLRYHSVTKGTRGAFRATVYAPK